MDIALVMVAAWGYRKTGRSLRQVFALRLFRPALVIATLLMLFGVFLVSIEASVLFQQVFPKPAAIKQMQERALAGPWGAFLAIGLGPLSEELLFRGLILDGFLKNYSARKAVLVCALLFAAFHVNPWQLLPALLAGLVLGWWRVETGSLWPCIFGHSLFNSVRFLLRAGLAHGAGPRPAPASPMPPLAHVLLATVGLLSLVGGTWLLRAWKRHPSDQPVPPV